MSSSRCSNIKAKMDALRNNGNGSGTYITQCYNDASTKSSQKFDSDSQLQEWRRITNNCTAENFDILENNVLNEEWARMLNHKGNITKKNLSEIGIANGDEDDCKYLIKTYYPDADSENLRKLNQAELNNLYIRRHRQIKGEHKQKRNMRILDHKKRLQDTLNHTEKPINSIEMQLEDDNITAAKIVQGAVVTPDGKPHRSSRHNRQNKRLAAKVFYGIHQPAGNGVDHLFMSTTEPENELDITKMTHIQNGRDVYNVMKKQMNVPMYTLVVKADQGKLSRDMMLVKVQRNSNKADVITNVDNVYTERVLDVVNKYDYPMRAIAEHVDKNDGPWFLASFIRNPDMTVPSLGVRREAGARRTRRRRY